MYQAMDLLLSRQLPRLEFVSTPEDVELFMSTLCLLAGVTDTGDEHREKVWIAQFLGDLDGERIFGEAWEGWKLSTLKDGG